MAKQMDRSAVGLSVVANIDESTSFGQSLCGCSTKQHKFRIASGERCCGARPKKQQLEPESLARDHENLCQD